MSKIGWPMDKKYGSRKFIVTMSGMFLVTGLALVAKMTGEVATVMGIAIGGYHAANAFEGRNGDG